MHNVLEPAHPAAIPSADGTCYFSLLAPDAKRLILQKLCEAGDSLEETLKSIHRYQMVNKECWNLLKTDDVTRDKFLCAMTARLACKWRGNKFDEVARVWKQLCKPLDPDSPLLEIQLLKYQSLKRIRATYQKLQEIFKNPESSVENLDFVRNKFEKGFPFCELIQAELSTDYDDDDTQEDSSESLQMRPSADDRSDAEQEQILSFMKSASIPDQSIALEKKYLEFRKAILQQDHDSVEAFIESGIDVERPILGWTPLMIAASARAGTTISKLIEAGASVNQTGSEGETPLFIAANFAYHEIAAILLQAGARINHLNAAGETPLMRAAFFDPVNNLALQPEETENEHEQTKALKYLVQTLLCAGADVNVKDPHEGLTALSLATLYGHETMVRQLLEAGADTTITSVDGKTALDIAMANKNQYLIELLSQAGKKVAAHAESTLETRSGCHKRKATYYEDEESDTNSEEISDHDSVMSDNSQSEASSNITQESEKSHESYSEQASDADDEGSISIESEPEMDSYSCQDSDQDFRPHKKRRCS